MHCHRFFYVKNIEVNPIMVSTVYGYLTLLPRKLWCSKLVICHSNETEINVPNVPNVPRCRK